MTSYLYKSTIMGYLKKYIRGLEYDQVSASLMSGEITLHAFELEIDAIREWVDTILPYTTEITRAYCSMAVVKIPWTQLRYKPVCITIPSLELDCTVHDMYDDVEWNCKVALAQREALLEQHINSAVSNIDDEAKRSLRRNTELGWWDFIMAGLQLRIESVSINLFTRSPSRITGMDDDAEPTKNPTRAFKIFLQGVFMAPCIQQGPFLEPSSSEEWSGLSYVDSPQEAFQFNRERNFLRTMRLYTINSLSVICAITGESLIEHTGGIRIKHRAESIAVERGTHGKRWSKLPFTCGGGLSIWLDELKVKGARSTVGKLYNIFNDLTQPTYIPIDNLPKNARHLHYSWVDGNAFKSMASEMKKQQQQQERSKRAMNDRVDDENEAFGAPFKDDIAGNLPKVPEYESVVRPYRHDYKHPSNPNEV
ncbi:UHRF1 binding protein 1, partial [Perkinsus olseni]